MQRRITKQDEALPDTFANGEAWRQYRQGLVEWLRQACNLGDLREGPVLKGGSETREGVVHEKLELTVDPEVDFAVPIVVHHRELAASSRHPAVLLSAEPGEAAELVSTLVTAGYLVVVPEHASPRATGQAHVSSVISLYGVGDTVGLPPLALRVWDDARTLQYLRQRPDVDPGQIAVVGLGTGGVDAAIAAALDDRVAAVGVVGAITVRDWVEQVAPRSDAFERIMPYLPRMSGQADWRHVYAAAAPRPLFVGDGTDRANWPAEAYLRVQRTVGQVYDLTGGSNRVTFQTALSPWGRDELRAWLLKTLPPAASGAATSPRRAAGAFVPPLFKPGEVAAYQPKGPADCFRQICFEYNSAPRPEFQAGRAFEPAVLREYFSQADPVAYAEFCRKINLDGVLLLAVPQGGYTTYLQTKTGEPYPYLAEHGLDFFGRVIQECHQRGISVFGYICLGWNFKAQRDHPGDFPSPGPNAIPSLNGEFADQAIEYAREILSNYPVDGLRTDILDHNIQARTAGDQRFYREKYGEDMPAVFTDVERAREFRIASISRFVRRFHEACKEVKPAVPIWHNWFNYKNVADLRDAAMVDIAYEEFADPFATLFTRGIFGTPGMISGKLLQNPQRRLCLALGGRAYDYFPVNRRTGLPDQALIDSFQSGQGYYGKDSPHWAPPGMSWFENDLAPFYAMVADIQPYLTGAQPVSSIAFVFSEASRFRFPQWKREAVVSPLRGLCQYYLDRNEAPAFLSSFHLGRGNLSRFRVILVPDMTGLKADEMQVLADYAQRGGQVLLTGQATLWDAAGRRLDNFVMFEQLGLKFDRFVPGPARVAAAPAWPGCVLPEQIVKQTFVGTTPVSGTTLASLVCDGNSWPLIHVNQTGKGRFAYLATSASQELTVAAIDYLRGPQPVVTSPGDKRAYLTWQPQARRWVLHLMDDGDVVVDIRHDMAAPTRVVACYPAAGCRADLRTTETGINLAVGGTARNRLLIME